MPGDRLEGLNLYLIGMMGAGKTTVGQELATRLGYRFFDSDMVIEQSTGQSITEIFATSGEAAFRQIESQVLAELASYTRLVIATGGGIVLQQMNWSYLRHGLIVWLDVPVDALYDRLKTDSSRPLLQQADPKHTLETLLNQRQSLYAQADLHVRIGVRETPEQICDRILQSIPGVLKPKLEPPSEE
ncbi:shikimate kinase [Egbenema bharatensis]|uniref:shikimate kinase n=1 Tax=Egbenema bharatensis TaxID=3463334 RepID=UPI003A874C38